MKKKNYQSPFTEVVMLETRCSILNGSGGSGGSIDIDGDPTGKDPIEGNPDDIDAAGNEDEWWE